MNPAIRVKAVKESLSQNGYCLLKDFDRSKLLPFAKTFGTPTADPRHPYPVRAISPQPIEKANPNTLSSRYGLASFPFHTDAAHWHTPPHILLLYCSKTGSGQRSTFLIDSSQWELSQQDLHILRTGVWRSGHLRSFLCTAMEFRKRSLRIRYDPGCMIPFSRSASDAELIIRRAIKSASLNQIDWSERTLLLLDNARMLHARGTAIAPDTYRVIERILLGGSYEDVEF